MQTVAQVETPLHPFVSCALPCTRGFGFLNRPRWSGYSYNFLFHHVQLAMGRHRLGSSHGTPLTELATVSASSWHRMSRLQDNYSFHAEARVVVNQLGLRLQDIIIFSYDSRRNIDWNLGLYICQHLAVLRYHYLGSSLACKMKRLQFCSTKYSSICDGLRQCDLCLTDLDCEVRRVGRGLLALVLTRWLNLGCGVNPDDLIGRRHLPPTSFFCTRGEACEVREEMSTRAGFQQIEGMPVSELVEKRQKVLNETVSVRVK